MDRWIRSRFFKTDINNDYGIYDVATEAVERSTQTEQEPTGNDVQAIGRQVSENEYDRMYED